MGPIQDSSQPGDDFSEKLLKLNASKESPSLSTRIYNAVRKPFHACYELWCGHEKQKWKVHVSAEHMSKQEFYGNSSKIALQSTIAHLKRINTLLGGKGVEWAKKLEYALKTRKSLLNNLIPTSFIAKKVREDVRSLKIGDSLIVPLLLRGQTPDSRVAVHDTVMEIKRTGTSSFSVILHNTGGRVGSRHERVCTEKDRIKYQTAYIYEEVPQENLCDDTFFLNLFNQSRERGKETEIPLYNLLTNLRGTPVSTIYRNQREY